MTHPGLIGNSLNRIDASGIDKIRSLISDLQAANCTLMFSGLKPGVLKYMKRAGLLEDIGEENIFSSYRKALETLQPYRKTHPHRLQQEGID
ncbi:STAS domain-containing protein [Ectothiorhodospira sp. BSL-9]|uniref:STAS domain-containing protein n=1 Tax=Ectothiorhodospira sp. BSL-9 TaxID=1442136 RepID=UPI0007B44EDD|nr:sodium-independent anion transporter [Ectothiorhodospira sp. BSL-9]ANB02071.1 hypothetical protein ECTOBSL9_1355 [Ectothiorhodospira sp. BSL-9]TVQ68653.1 MAG: sodium-independent anion transporter [Chromatiaceae bacterium]